MRVIQPTGCSYATGVFSSRRIEQSTYDNIAVRLLTADTHPDHDTLCKFRRENQDLFQASFVRVLALAQELKLARCGQITLAIDGTKVDANASRHSAVSYQRLCAVGRGKKAGPRRRILPRAARTSRPSVRARILLNSLFAPVRTRNPASPTGC